VNSVIANHLSLIAFAARQVQSSLLALPAPIICFSYLGRPSLAFFPFPARLTRSRKLAAEDAFCCQFVAQTNRLRLTARSSFKDAAKNEDRKLAAENFVGRNGQK
jgi:hypothetical protein